MLKIRLRRMGSRHRPFYRVVVGDSRRVPAASALEEIGHYDPRNKPASLSIDVERADHWLSQGAQPSKTVERLITQARLAPAAPAPPSTKAEAPAAPAPTSAKAKAPAMPAAEAEPEPEKEAPAVAEAPAAEAKAEAPAAEAKAEAPAAEAKAEAPAAETEKVEAPAAPAADEASEAEADAVEKT